jgi:hypothetical protein
MTIEPSGTLDRLLGAAIEYRADTRGDTGSPVLEDRAVVLDLFDDARR